MGKNGPEKMAKNGHLLKNRMTHPNRLGMPFPKMVLLLTLGQKWPKRHQIIFPAHIWNAPFTETKTMSNQSEISMKLK